MNKVKIFGALIGLAIYLSGWGLGYLAADTRKQDEINEVKISSFNDGFLDGACHNGEDGFGNRCR